MDKEMMGHYRAVYHKLLNDINEWRHGMGMDIDGVVPAQMLEVRQYLRREMYHAWIKIKASERGQYVDFWYNEKASYYIKGKERRAILKEFFMWLKPDELKPMKLPAWDDLIK